MALTAYISYHQVLVQLKLLCEGYIEMFRCGCLQSECLEIRTPFHEMFLKENVLVTENSFFSELADFYDTVWLDLIIKLNVISHCISQLTVKVPGHKKLLGSFHMPLWEQTHSVHTVFRRFSCVKNLCTADYRGSPFYACLTLYSCVRQIYLMQ